MRSSPLPAAVLGIIGSLAAVAAVPAAMGQTTWLDEPAPDSWNRPGMIVPAAPDAEQRNTPARCRARTRAPASAEDRAVADRGWDLVGARQEQAGVVVLTGTAAYDGMCRPWSLAIARR